MSDKINRLTEAQRKTLISKSSKSLPDNPSDRGYTADQIKRKQGYELGLYLFDLLDAAIAEANSALDEMSESSSLTFAGLDSDNVYTGENEFAKASIHELASDIATLGSVDAESAHVSGTSSASTLKAESKLELENGAAIEYGETVYTIPYDDGGVHTLATKGDVDAAKTAAETLIDGESSKRAEAVAGLERTVSANKAQSDAALAAKADLVEGQVPVSQLPPGAFGGMRDMPFRIIATDDTTPYNPAPNGPDQTFSRHDVYEADLTNYISNKFSDYLYGVKYTVSLACFAEDRKSDGFSGMTGTYKLRADYTTLRIKLGSSLSANVDFSRVARQSITYGSILVVEFWLGGTYNGSNVSGRTLYAYCVSIEEVSANILYRDDEEKLNRMASVIEGLKTVVVSQSIAIGETANDAFAGNRGKALETDMAAVKAGKADLENGVLKESQIPEVLRRLNVITMKGGAGFPNTAVLGTIVLEHGYAASHTWNEFCSFLNSTYSALNGGASYFGSHLVYVMRETDQADVIPATYACIASRDNQGGIALRELPSTGCIMVADDGIRFVPGYGPTATSTATHDTAIHLSHVYNSLIASNTSIGEISGTAYEGSKGKELAKKVTALESGKADIDPSTGKVLASQLPAQMGEIMKLGGELLNLTEDAPIVAEEDFSTSYFTNAKIAELFPNCVDEETEQIPYLTVFLVYVTDGVITRVGPGYPSYYARINVTPKFLWHNRHYNLTYELIYDGTSTPPTSTNPFSQNSPVDYRQFGKNTMVLSTADNQMYRFLGYATTATNTESASVAPTSISSKVFAQISSSLALGETSSTAFPGDRGKAAEDAIEDLQDDVSDLQDDVGDLTSGLSTEASSRESADSALSTRIDAEATARAAADTAEAAARAAADTALSQAITEGDANTLALAKAYANTIKNDATTYYNDQTFEDDVIIKGNLLLKGRVFTVESTTVSTEDVNIELAKGNTLPLTQIAGFHVPNYDGTHVGGIGFDASGYAYVGDMVKNQDGSISRGDAQEFATRSDHGEWDFDGELPVWDAAGKKFKPSNKSLSGIEADYNSKIALAQSILFSEEAEDGTIHLKSSTDATNLTTFVDEEGLVHLAIAN